jgi:hypothetical protein
MPPSSDLADPKRPLDSGAQPVEVLPAHAARVGADRQREAMP